MKGFRLFLSSMQLEIEASWFSWSKELVLESESRILWFWHFLVKVKTLASSTKNSLLSNLSMILSFLPELIPLESSSFWINLLLEEFVIVLLKSNGTSSLFSVREDFLLPSIIGRINSVEFFLSSLRFIGKVFVAHASCS